MASLIPGYVYDIFISYRQKDNRYDGWVTEFVEHLEAELESTFKEEVSVYFDINSHDGLLETHDVDASLKNKLKCVVFIPIISRTYCDPKSYAWQHEFKAFIELASQDQFGLKIKLPNGNVAGRILPIQIHDLDAEDKALLENELAGALRAVEFIYKEPGVNRPLTPHDHEKKNLNNTRYRNQINKVANAIKELMSGIKGEPSTYGIKQKKDILRQDEGLIQEKSIIVLPFENISPDPDQEYFSDGLTEEIITDLSYIPELLVISRNSAMTFKGTKRKTGEIAREVNVRYVLEGSVRKAGNNLRITAQLIDGTNDSHIWAEKYTGTLEDVFDIQEKVSRSIAEALKIKLSSTESNKIMAKPIWNVQLHEYYLKAKYEINQMTEDSLKRAIRIIENGLEIFGENALLYATMGEATFIYYDMGIDISDNILEEVEGYAKRALSLEPGIAQGHKLYGYLEQAKGSLIESYYHLKKAYHADPNDPTILAYSLASPGIYLGKPSFAESPDKKLLSIDPLSAVNYCFIGISHYFKGNFEEAVKTLQNSIQIDPEFFLTDFWLPPFLAANKQKSEALDFLDRLIQEDKMSKVFKELNLFFKYVLMGERTLALETLSDETKNYTWVDPLFSALMPGYYSLINEKGEAFRYLNHSVDRDFINYPFFSEIDPFLENIREEDRFKKLMIKVKYEWDNFEP